MIDPIHNAIELVERRCQALATELNVIPPNLKTLQNVLQGSVLARKFFTFHPYQRISEVHAGPMKICEIFLGNESKYEKEATNKLRETIDTFLELCGRAIELNGALISSEQMEFQLKLEQGYQQIKQEFEQKYTPSSTQPQQRKAPHLAERMISPSVRDLLYQSRQQGRQEEQESVTDTTEPPSEPETDQEDN